MEKPQCRVQADEQSIPDSILCLFIIARHSRLASLKVVIGKVLVPEVIDGLTHVSKIIVLELLISLGDQCGQSGQDPFLGKREFFGLRWLEVGVEVSEGKLINVPKLIAELLVSNDSLDVEVNSLLDHIIHQGEPKSISTALRNTIRELLSFLDDALFNFLWRQV